jgi:hypothetical protein
VLVNRRAVVFEIGFGDPPHAAIPAVMATATSNTVTRHSKPETIPSNTLRLRSRGARLALVDRHCLGCSSPPPVGIRGCGSARSIGSGSGSTAEATPAGSVAKIGVTGGSPRTTDVTAGGEDHNQRT